MFFPVLNMFVEFRRGLHYGNTPVARGGGGGGGRSERLDDTPPPARR